MAEQGSLLKATDISKSFAGVQALKGVELEIYPGEIHCLAGENGCGKSTLIKIISGAYTPDSGTIVFDGHCYQKISPLEAIASGIQVIYQDFAIFPNLSVMENLAFNSELAAGRKLVDWKRFRRIAEEAVAKIGFSVDLEAKLADLSVAQKQLVAICRALMFNAKLIIMDEPTTSLTKREVQALFKVILDLQKQGIAILFVSHKLDEVFDISERFTIFRNGEHVITGNTKDIDVKKFTYYMTGREFSDQHFEGERMEDKPVLEVKNLGFYQHFQNLSFALHRGEVLGITGLLDSGRSELPLTLFGLEQPTEGGIYVDGKLQRFRSPQDAIAAKIAYVPEDRLSEGLFLPRSIGDNIVISEIDRLSHRGIIDKKRFLAEIRRWVEELSVKTNNPDNAVQTLSGGNQQRIVLAKWLATEPQVLILNGPTVGVDIGSKHDIHRFLHALAQKGMAIIVISDDLPEIISNCSRVLVMKNGRFVAQIDPKESSISALSEAMM